MMLIKYTFSVKKNKKILEIKSTGKDILSKLKQS